MKIVNTENQDRILQGDIYKDIEYIEYIRDESGVIEISKIQFPLVYIMTQDCDLQQDHSSRDGVISSQDKILLSVLATPIYNYDHVIAGTHLSDLNMKMSPIDRKSTMGKLLLQNKLERYHFIEFPEDVHIVPSVIDFKHYFSLNVEYLRSKNPTNFVCRISELFRESVSYRFTNFLGRIGLPEINS